MAFSQPKQMAINLPGDPVHVPGQGSASAGNEVLLIDVTVPAGKTRLLSQVICESKVEGRARIYQGSTLIGSASVHPLAPTVNFPWIPTFPVTAGAQIRVTFEAALGTPPLAVKAFLHGSDINA